MTKFDTTTIGGRIKEVRIATGLSQEQLAEKLCLENKASVSSYETNRRVPAADMIADIASICNCTTDYLLYGRKSANEIIDQAVNLMQGLSEQHQKLVLEQIKLLVNMEAGTI